MKKVILFLKRKRVQSAIVLGIVWLLKQFDVAVDEASMTATIMMVVQFLAGIWHVWGWVDAHPGHNGKEAA